MQVKEKTSIVQANFLIENRPKLTLDETRLFLTIIGSINKDDADFKPLEVPVAEFAKLWGIDTRTAYDKIKTALRGLVNKEFFIEGINPKTGKLRFLSASYISMAAYEEGAGYATVEISKAFKPYLLELKERYTLYILQNVLNLTTVNAIRNYELLKQFQGVGFRLFTVSEYKAALKIENKYARNTDLRVNVVEPAVAEINEHTDILVSYEFLGRGQKAKIRFTIKKNEHLEQLPPAEDPNQISLFDADPIDDDELDERFGQVPEEDDDISYIRDALGDPAANLSVAKITELRALAYQYLVDNKFELGMTALQREEWMYSYVRSQSLYVQSHGYRNFYAYVRSAIINNHAQV